MELAELQRCIMRGIDPLGSADEQQAAHDMLASRAGLNASERLYVYRNNITSVRVRALQAIYPVCEMILGTDCFSGVARAYCWQARDDCADLNGYGSSFPAFLGNHGQATAFAQLPYLEEMAKLEWYWHAAYYAADSVPFDQDAFAIAIARADRLRFMLADGLVLLQVDYPVREIWQRHRAQEKIASIPSLDDCEYLCIHRQQHEPLVTIVSASMYRLLETVQQGSSLEQLGEYIGEQLPGLLPVAVQHGWISGFTSDP